MKFFNYNQPTRYCGSNERNTKKIEKIYQERFKKNYTNTGEAFRNDALVLSDREFCKAYVVVAYTQVDFIFGKNWRDMIYDKIDNSF